MATLPRPTGNGFDMLDGPALVVFCVEEDKDRVLVFSYDGEEEERVVVQWLARKIGLELKIDGVLKR